MMPESAQRPILSPARIRELDRIAIEELGIPGLILMENAGLRAADRARSLLAAGRHDGAWILCGRGNNAGDGFVIARHLVNAGWPVAVTLVGAASGDFGPRTDAGVNLAAARATHVRIGEVGDREAGEVERETGLARPLIVDALLGTGLRGAPRAPFDAWIRFVNDGGHAVLAVDVPSGLDAETGDVGGVAIRAAHTVTFAAAKTGFYRGRGPEHTGEIEVVDISIPAYLLAAGG